MKEFIKHLIKDTIRLYFQRTSKNDILRLVYYSTSISFAFCLSLLFCTITTFRHYFKSFEISWLLILTTTAMTSSDNGLTILKNSLRLVFALCFGCTISYVSIAIVGRHVWPNCFIFLFFVLVSTGPMLSSRFLPFPLGKYMFLAYFYLVFADFPKDHYYWPTDQLKFSLVSFIALGSCIITCLLFRIPFGNIIFIKVTRNILKRNSIYLRELQRKFHLIICDEYDKSNYKQQVVEESSMYQENIKRMNYKIHFNYYEYSRLLNVLDKYLNDSRKEFWASDFVFHYEKIQILLERNHKKLYSIGFGLHLDDHHSKQLAQEIKPLVHYYDMIITEIENIFTIMVKQLNQHFKHTSHHQYEDWFKSQHLKSVHSNEYYASLESNEKNNQFKEPFHIDNMDVVLNFDIINDFKEGSLEWNQIQINKSFEKIDQISKSIIKEFGSIIDENTVYNPDDENNTISKIIFCTKGIITFSSEQKLLSREIFLVAYHKSLTRNIPQGIQLIISSMLFILNINKYIQKRKEKKRIDHEEFPSIIRVQYSTIDKFKIFFKYLLFKRILFNWMFTLKYSIILAGGAVGIYEIRDHSNFILFRNLSWALNTYIIVSSPNVGAIVFTCAVRIIGTIIGGFLAYTSIVLSNLGGTNVARAFIFTGWSFWVVIFAAFIVKQQPFEKIIGNIVYTYSIVSIPLYYSEDADVILTLLRIAHTSFGIIVACITAFIFPYFDFRQLEKNCYKIPKSIIKMVDFLLNYSFNIKEDDNQFTDNNLESLNKDNTDINNNNLENNNLIIPDNNNSNNSNNNNNQFKKITFQEYRVLISRKYIKLRRIFPIQRHLLLDAKFELLFNYSKYKRIERILNDITQLHNLFGALEFMIIQNDQSNIRKIGNLVSTDNQLLIDNLNHTSELLAHLPPDKDNIGFTKRRSSKLHLTIDQDNSHQICINLIHHINQLINNVHLKKTELYQMNAILYILHCFIKQYNHVYNELVKYKDIIVIDKLNNNNNNDNDNLNIFN